MTRARISLRPGTVVGLLGGSFDPPHVGHVHISREALKRFGLNQLWWLVSPGNPLKKRGPAAMERRVQAAKQMMAHPRVRISTFESRSGTRYTAETIAALRRSHPHVRFVWLMGADNLAQFHLWKDWRQIMETVPVGILARPGDRQAALHSPAARAYRNAFLKPGQSQLLGRADTPAWCFASVPMLQVSSSAIRAEGRWPPVSQSEQASSAA